MNEITMTRVFKPEIIVKNTLVILWINNHLISVADILNVGKFDIDSIR